MANNFVQVLELPPNALPTAAEAAVCFDAEQYCFVVVPVANRNGMSVAETGGTPLAEYLALHPEFKDSVRHALLMRLSDEHARKTHRQRLEEMLAGVTDENRPAEIDFGPTVVVQQRERRIRGEELARQAKEIYARLKPQVEKGNIGKFILIDVESEQYEIDKDSIVAGDRLYARLPDPQLFCIRIGHHTAHSMSGGSTRIVE